MFVKTGKKQLVVTVLLILAQFIQICESNNALTVTNSETTEDDDVQVAVEQPSTVDPFIPSREWKPVKPGQTIPSGLHIRINLQTGEKEAKLISENGVERSANDEQESYSTRKQYSLQELKEALKAIKAEDISNIQIESSSNKRKFRSLEELKKDFTDLNLSVKTETDILMDLLKRYRSCRNHKEKVFILQDLEYIAHQFDVAQDFVRLDGLKLLLPDLNSTDTDVRSFVCATLGAAMQGNPKVQIAVLEHNGLTFLLHLLVLDPSLLVRSKSLFALSCLVRHFPFAQQRFVQNGGIPLLAAILQEENTVDPSSLKIKLKIVHLLNDLLVEQDFNEKHSTSEEKTERFSLRRLLVEHGFCDLVGHLLLVPRLDFQESVIATMKSLSPDCAFRKESAVLQQLRRDFESRTEPEESEAELLGNIRELLSKSKSKDEL